MRTLRVLVTLFGLMVGNLILAIRGRSTRARREQRILATAQQLGMVWTHVLCTLSLRAPIIRPSLQKALIDMRDRGHEAPLASLRPQIEATLGKPLNQVFSAFEATPFAATTVSQIHRARLRQDGCLVAVKIQHPDAAALFQKDMRVILRVFALFKFLGIKTRMRWDDLYHELEELVTRELDYNYEMSALKTLRKNLRGSKVYVPAVYETFTGPKLLVMEYIQGALLSDIRLIRQQDPQRVETWLKANNIDLEKVGRSLFDMVYTQVFEHHFFHGDLKTSNIILLKDNNIAIIDCVRAGSLDQESRRKQRLFLKELARGEYGTAAEIYFLLAFRLPKITLKQVQEQMLRIWRLWEMHNQIPDFDFDKKSMTTMIHAINHITYRAGFAAQWSLSRLQRAWIHLDVALKQLYPAMNYPAMLDDYLEASDRRVQTQQLKDTPMRLIQAIDTLQSIPQRLEEYNIFQENIMRRQAQFAQASSSKMDRILATLFGWVRFHAGLACLLLLPLLLDQWQAGPFLGPQLSHWLQNTWSWPQEAKLLCLSFAFTLFLVGHHLKHRFQGPPS